MACSGECETFDLLGSLHRGAFVRLSAAGSRHFQGLSQGGRQLQLPQRLRRRLREIEAAWGIHRHITRESVGEFLRHLDDVLGAKASGSDPKILHHVTSVAVTKG